jgi:hypothetical protein
MKQLQQIFLLFAMIGLITSCSKDEVGGNDNTNNPDMGGNEITGEIWTGSNITFSKADGADPSEEANQDRITNNVWITRGNNGGQIFNIKQESASNKSDSPIDTEWAIGTTSDVADLTFSKFRDAIKPQDIVGRDMVLHLITDDIYIDIKFSNWSQSKEGGFDYSRSTQ